jgi:hypothetical protein
MSTSRRRKATAPSYRHHKPSGQAFVQFKGKRHYLGKHGTPESRQRYAQFIAEHWSPDQPTPPPPPTDELTLIALVDRYWTFAEQNYRKHGEPTGTAQNQRPALRKLLELYGSQPAKVFGPKALKTLRQTWISAGLAIKTINSYTGIIRGMFKWAMGEELVSIATYMPLANVPDLKRGKGLAREPAPIGPVADELVEATLPHLRPIAADMVRVQRFTGCRPQEIRILRPCDVTRLGPDGDELDVWEYRPSRHKTEHRGRRRVILIGPKAQEVLRPYLLRLAFTPDAFAFTTALGRPYSKDRYIRAIRRACERALEMPRQLRDSGLRTAAKKVKAQELPAAELQALRAAAKAWREAHCWHPNQLRHTAATAIRARFSAEASQVVLGHADLRTAEIYAERDLDKARSIMRAIG